MSLVKRIGTCTSLLTVLCFHLLSPFPAPSSFLHLLFSTPSSCNQDIKAINSMPLPGYIVTPVSSVVVNHSTMPHSHTTISQYHTTVSIPHNHVSIPYHCLIPIPPYLNTIPLSQFHTTMFQFHTTVSIPHNHVSIPHHHVSMPYYTSMYACDVTLSPLSYKDSYYTCFSHCHNNHFSDLQDRGSSTINLIHPSSKKQLCDSFRVEDPAEFDQYKATN